MGTSLPKLKPRGKRGRVAVKRLGRSYRTGMFEKIAREAAKKYGSEEIGRRVAAKVYWQKVRGKGKKGGYLARALRSGK